MKLLGFEITRTKQAGLSPVQASPGGWFRIFESFTGAWQRNEEIRVDSALANPTLYACITLIAGDIAKLRPRIVERDANGIWSEVASPFDRVLRRPNHYQTRIDFFEWWIVSKLCHGNTYALKARDGRGMVQALYILDPCRVTPLVAPDGSVFYQLSADQFAPLRDTVVVPARELIHDTMCALFHPLCGVSPIYAAGYPALQGLETRKVSGKFFSNGSKPGGILSGPGQISQETAARLKEYWDQNFSGDNIGKIAVLGDGLKYEAMAVTAEQSQLVEQLKMSDEDIAKCFTMPRHKVGIGPDPTHHNIEALNQQYYTDCLQKHLEKLEVKLDDGLEVDNVPGKTLGVEFDLDDLLRMDTSALIKAEKDASGIKTIDESRKRLGLGPIPGGSTVYLQHQDYPIEVIYRRQDVQPSSTPTPPAPAAGQPAADKHALYRRVKAITGQRLAA